MAVLTRERALTRGTEIALIDEFGETAWAALDARVNALVHALRGLGLKAGDTLAVVLGNRREWFEVALACAHGGFVYVPVNWHWVADELAYVFQDAQAAAVVVEPRYAEAVAVALRDPRGAGVRAVIAIGGAEKDALREEPRAASYEALIAAAPAHEPEDQAMGGPMFYTSGTTGRPKGVRGALAAARGVPPEMLQMMGASFTRFFPIPGRTLLCGPFYHSAQWAFSFLPLAAGSSVVMQHKFDAAGVLDLIDRCGVTNLHLVPTQMKRLLDLPADVKARFSGRSLAIAIHGAAPCPPAVKRGMIEWWGEKISEYYGSTEGSIISLITAPEWLAKGGSVGKPSEMVEVLVIGDDGRPVPPGTDGQLYFRNLSGADFVYHNDPEKTAAAHLAPGVFTTGDVGRIDADGYLWLSDRKIDMIISGGVNIYPAEIEGVLNAHPAVEDCAVIGVPDEEYGESVKAIVVAKPDAIPGAALAAELIAHCRVLLAGYKAPRSVDFIDAIPRSAAGKIQKKPLRDPYWRGAERRI
ncbi:MAG: AMP-binding protein [Hydrogenophilaceae bacterium]|jgi:long-chain acyl-CoA synthetase|nr:AMP-binding protein [Hydrogenophilaceae bacterium]